MRTKIHILLAMGLPFFLMLTICATAQNEDISIIDFKYQLVRTTTIGTLEARYFTFWITFTNSGDKTSTNITAYLEDPEFNAPLEIDSFKLAPNENKTLKYEDWPTTLLGDIIINITYDPTSQDIESTPFNSGKQQYTLSTGSNNTNQTPALEAATIILIIALVFLVRKRNEKN